MEHVIIILFLGFFALEFFIEFALNEANMIYIRQQWRNHNIPDLLKNKIGVQEYQKTVDYALTKGRFQRWNAVYGSLLTLVVLFGGVLPYLDEIARHLGGLLPSATEAKGIVFCLLTGLVFFIFGLPLEIYSTFVIEESFGFNKTTARVYVTDKLKGIFLSLILGIPFLFGILWLMRATGTYWWIWVFCFIFAFQFLMMLVYPTLIAPLFNKFEPLPENPLKEEIEKLAARVGIQTSGIYTMDGSKRSGHSNAYFTGIGKTKRIVLFDTLLRQLDQRQLLAVLAHEMGHYKNKHVQKMLAFSAFFLFGGLYILSFLLNYEPLFTAFGLDQPTNDVALVLFSLIAGPFTFWLGPVMNCVSRKHEYQADGFAVQLVKDGRALEESLINLTVKNLSNLTPQPWYSAYHYSHPTTVERVQAIRVLATE